MGAAAIPLITTVAGAALNTYNTNRTEKDQRNAIAQQLLQSQQRQKEGAAMVEKVLDQQRQSGPDAYAKGSMESYLDTLRRTRANSMGGMDQVGDVSDRYTEGNAAANDSLFNTGVQRAGMLSAVDAPGLQRQDEGINFGRLQTNIGLLNAQSDVDKFLSDLRLRTASQRNQGLDALGNTLYAYGSSGGNFGYGSGAATKAGTKTAIKNGTWG